MRRVQTGGADNLFELGCEGVEVPELEDED